MKTLKTIGLMLLSAAIGMVLLMGAIALDASDNVCICVAFGGAILSGLAMGVFDVKSDERTMHQRIKDAARGYQQAA